MTDVQDAVVTVEILGQQYPIRSSLNTSYVTDLAAYVDQKMHTASDRSAGGDTVRVAVLAALNIADEYFRYRQSSEQPDETLQKLTVEIENLVDQAITAQ